MWIKSFCCNLSSKIKRDAHLKRSRIAYGNASNEMLHCAHKGNNIPQNRKQSKAGKLFLSYPYLKWEQCYSIVTLKSNIHDMTEKQHLTNNFTTYSYLDKNFYLLYLINIYFKWNKKTENVFFSVSF